MASTNHLLSFVTDDDGSTVSIHLDLSGLDLLISELEALRSQLLAEDCPHTHLFSPHCGRDELTTTMLQNHPGEVHSVHHVKIYGWNEDWAKRHGLK